METSRFGRGRGGVKGGRGGDPRNHGVKQEGEGKANGRCAVSRCERDRRRGRHWLWGGWRGGRGRAVDSDAAAGSAPGRWLSRRKLREGEVCCCF